MTISNDLLHEILRRVPVKHLLRCRCVSKGWCSLIDSPEFVKLHMDENIDAVNNGGLIISEPGKLYLADYESLHEDVTNPVEIVDPVIKGLVSDARLIGSANGLVCFCTRNYDVMLMNPSTRKCMTLPVEPYELRPTFCHNDLKCGFGYDDVSYDYKFVKFGTCDDPLCEIIVTVYSVSTDSWTRIQNAGLSRDIEVDSQWGMFAGGALFWKAMDIGGKSEIIVGFDLGLGQFREVAWDGNWEGLYGFGGNLYTLQYLKSRVDVFQMNDYSAENPWSKAFSVRRKNVLRGHCVEPLMYSEDLGEVLILVDCKRPVWYHLESERIEKVWINKIARLTSDVEFYTESLFQFPQRQATAESIT